MTSSALERLIRLRLDGTFTRVGGAVQVVPRDFMPSHEEQVSDRHLSEAEAASILKHFRRGGSSAETAASFGISHSTVYSIANGKRWERFRSRQINGIVGVPLP